MMKHLKSALSSLLAAAAILTGSQAAQSQSWPTHPIRILVPVGPSAPPDILARVIAAELTKSEGWPIVVENKVGAIHTLAVSDLLRAPADGHTIFVSSDVFSAAPALLQTISFDPVKDLQAVVKISTTFNALVTSPSSPINSVADLEKAIKANPDKLSYASGGYGTPAHLITEFFKQQINGRANHVPYTSPASAITDTMTGAVDFAFLTTLPVTQLVASGKMKAIAVAANQRLRSMPDVPTVGEQGYPYLVQEGWAGFHVKAGTAEAIVERLNKAVIKAMETPDVASAYEKLGAQTGGGSADEFKALYEGKLKHWSEVIRKGNIKVNP